MEDDDDEVGGRSIGRLGFRFNTRRLAGVGDGIASVLCVAFVSLAALGLVPLFGLCTLLASGFFVGSFDFGGDNRVFVAGGCNCLSEGDSLGR